MENNPNISITSLPSNVTNLIDCIRHEIQVIEDEFMSKQAAMDNDKVKANDEDHDHDDGKVVGDDDNDDNNNDDDNNENNRSAFADLSDLEDALDDGFLCVDLAVLERKLQIWHQLFTFGGHLDVGGGPHDEVNYLNGNGNVNVTVTPYYAIKCNPDPQIVHWLAKAAAKYGVAVGYDCASVAELELAKDRLPILLKAGHSEEMSSSSMTPRIPTTRIVYANPQRAEAALMQSLELFATEVGSGSKDGNQRDDDNGNNHQNGTTIAPSSLQQDLWLTLDGVEEVYKIHTALGEFENKHGGTLVPPTIQLVIRIWVPDGHSQVPLGEKFGCPMDGIPALVRACHDVQLADNIIGISFHCGSGCEDVDTYHEALAMAQRALRRIDDEVEALSVHEDHPNGNRRRPCWLLDMGGGYPGWDGLGGDEGRFSGVGPKDDVSVRDGDFGMDGKTGISSIDGCVDNVHDARDDDDDNGFNNNDHDDSNGETPSSTTTVATIAHSIRPLITQLARQQLTSATSGVAEEYRMTLIAEPGRYFVEASAALASRIYQKQQVPLLEGDIAGAGAHDAIGDGALTTTATLPQYRNVYKIAHGVEGVFKDVLLCGESFVPQPLQVMEQKGDNGGVMGFDNQNGTTKNHNNKKKTLSPSRVLGPSGAIDDVVCQHCWLPDDLQVGDWLVFDRMGAYTMSIASRTGRPVVRYVLGGTATTSGIVVDANGA